MLSSMPAALAQQGPPLPSGGVLVEGRDGLKPSRHTHGHLCTPEKRYDRFRCVLGKGEWALLYFSFRGSDAQGCAFRVSHESNPQHGDYFKLVPHKDPEFRGRCGTNARESWLLFVFPTH